MSKKKGKLKRAKNVNDKKKGPTFNAQRLIEPRASWSQRVAAGERMILGDFLFRGVLIMLNQGPGKVVIDPDHQAVELPASCVRVLSVGDRIEVQNTDVKAADLAFDYIPVPK